jgi:hypothetical protein
MSTVGCSNVVPVNLLDIAIVVTCCLPLLVGFGLQLHLVNHGRQ